MPHPPRLLQFVEDEIRRSGPLMQQVLDTTLMSLRRGDHDLPPSALAYQGELAHALSLHRAAALASYVAALRETVQSELAQSASPSRAASPRRSLSLVDESEVAVDVELSRTIEVINDVAEYELRELRAYTSALAGDASVSRETNPFRASTQARALWAGMQAVPVARGYQVALLQVAARPLAQALRLAYAAACTRLEDAGVEPAAFGTIVLATGSRSHRPETSVREEPADLHALRESMPVPLDEPSAPLPMLDEALLRAEARLGLLPDDAGTQTRAQWLDSHRQQLVQSAPTRLDQQAIELVGRLFDAILVDASLPEPTLWLISRLQASALRVALRDPSMLDDYGHAVWRFLDRLALQSDVPLLDPQGLQSLHQHARRLVDHMVGVKEPEASLYDWGLQRLAAFDHHQLERRVQAAAPQIEALRKAEANFTTLDDSAPGTLDVASLDTVPASLLDMRQLDEEARRMQATRWLNLRHAGDLVRIFLQGRWRAAQILWSTELGEIWLLHELPEEADWPVHRRALERLHLEGLLVPLEPRSLVQASAEKVMRELGKQQTVD